MNIKVYQVIDLVPVLNKIGETNLSLKTAISIAELIDAFKKPSEIIDQRRTELLNEYVEKDEDGKPIILDDGKAVKIKNMLEFKEKMNAFLDTEVDINYKPLDLNLFENEDFKITANEYLLLKELFDTDKE